MHSPDVCRNDRANRDWAECLWSTPVIRRSLPMAIDIKDLNRQASGMRSGGQTANNPETRCAPLVHTETGSVMQRLIPKPKLRFLDVFYDYMLADFQPATPQVRWEKPRPAAQCMFKQLFDYTVIYPTLKPAGDGRRRKNYEAGLSQGVDSRRSTRKSSMDRRIRGIWRREA